MKLKIKKWTLRVVTTGVFIASLLILIVLNPILTYAHKTTHENHTIFHSASLDSALITQISDANNLLKTSEFYNPNLKLEICLNDGSNYPTIVKTLRGRAFAWGFYNKVILYGTVGSQENTVELNGYRWNLKQLLAHEMTHCLQFDHLGLRQSKPFANIPNWKWEGYAEYISRQSDENNSLLKNIDRFIASDQTSWAITLIDHTIAPREYYEYWILVQYCIDIKKMNYQEVLGDTSSKEFIKLEMMKWYHQNK
jgi:hypothetical protein